MLDSFPKEEILLHKLTGEVFQINALVSYDKFLVDNTSVVIEEGDFFERTIPNGAVEYYRVIERGYIKGNQRIPDHYQTHVEKVPKVTMEQVLAAGSSQKEQKPRKLFISHSSKDKEFMTAFVELLEDIGMPDGTIVCTSVPGYGTPGGIDIFDWLRDQFIECNLRVIYALSHNYYSSPASLNEMGASWLAHSDDTLLLLPKFGYSDIKGCVNSRKQGIKLDSDEMELRYRLDEFKDMLLAEYNLNPLNRGKWERNKNGFITKVHEIVAKNEEEAQVSDTESGDHSRTYSPVNVIDNPGNIPVDVAFLLVYAANGDGRIVWSTTLSGTTISAAGRQFMADNSHREIARWQEALDCLITWGWVRPVGSKGQIFEITGTGYDKADWLKDGMDIDTSKEPLEQLKEFE